MDALSNTGSMRGLFSYRPQRWIAVALTVALSAAATVSQAQVTWTGTAADGNWGTAGNWSTTLLNNFNSGLVFSGAAPITSTTNTLTGGTASSLSFLSGASAYTLSGNSLAVSGSVTNSSTSLQTINNNLTLTRTSTVTLTAGGGNVTIGSTISGTGGITLAGSGTLTLSSSNSYSGGTLMGANTATLVLGNVNAMGTGIFTCNGGTVMASVDLSAGISTPFQTYQGSGVNVLVFAGTNSMKFNSNLNVSGDRGMVNNMISGSLTLSNIALGSSFYMGGSGTTTISGTMSGGGFTHDGTGTTFIGTTDNTYTGRTFIGQGVLVVPRLANGGANSSIGASTNAAANLFMQNNGVLRYTGTGATTDRNFTIGNNAVATGTGAWDASGSGALVITGSAAYGSTNQTRTLILTGTSTAANTLSGVIGNNGTGAVSLIKSGAGTWVVSGSNSYAGATTISGGMLRFGSVNSLYAGGTASWTAANIRTGSGATLAFNVGGTNELTTGNVTTLLTNLAASSSVTNGMNAGSILGFDTSNASGGTFTINDAIANTTGASGGARGLRKLGVNTLVLGTANTYTGATSVEAGTLAFGLVSALNSSSGIGINAGAILDYTGATSGTLSRNVTVATSGTGTIRNSGGQKLTLFGTLTKDGRVLRLTGGAFDVTGQIVGASANSDLLVDGTSTVTLLSANTYNGPTFVNQASNLVVGIDNAIPNASVVSLGNATTTGTLTLGAFSNSISQLIFAGSGGTLSLSGDKTTAVQLVTGSSLTLGANAGLVITGSNFTEGLYRLVAYTGGLSGTFAAVSGLDSNYVVRYGTVNANEIDAQRKANQSAAFTMTTGTVSRALVNTNVAVSGTITNSSPANSTALTLGLSATGLNGSGFTTGSVSANSSLAVTGTLATGPTAGTQNWSITNIDTSAITGTSTATGSLEVVNQRSFSVSNSGTINLGNFLRTAAVSGSATISSTGLNATTANASLLAAFTGTNTDGFSLSTLDSTTFNGGTSSQSALYTLSGSAAAAGGINGTFTSPVTAELGSIAPVTVSLTGTAYDPAIASFTAVSATTSWFVNIGEFNQNTGDHTAGFSIFNLFTGDQTLTADLMLQSISLIGPDAGSLSLNLTGTSFGSLTPGLSSNWLASLSSLTTGSFTNQYQLNFVSAKNGQSLGGPQSMTLTVTGIIVVPEPGALALAGLGIGFAGWLGCCRRRHVRASATPRSSSPRAA